LPHFLLNTAVQEFIKANTDASITKLALQKNPFPDINWNAILEQIAARQKAKDKLPTWFSTDGILYPSKISVEQTSSEKTAQYKASLLSGIKMIDLTGGFGVDAYYFSKQFQETIHCEMNLELATIVKHNFEKLQANSITCYHSDSLAVLKTLNTKFDWIYIDPSRRNESKGKVFLLKDCLPNVPELLPIYFEFTENILIKTAPILDISAGLKELLHVKKIHIVAVENEVKELLWEISKGYSEAITIETINFKKDKPEVFNFILSENSERPTYALPKKYLYEPNSAIMKSGGFEEVSAHFHLEKLHPHSHLYTSETIIDFPGRIFEVQSAIAYQKHEMKPALENQKANITTRNFPDSVEEIRKKWKIKEGGDRYCFFTTDANNHKIVLICTKI
jgi:hypothetical protein